ncbi:hypothetical protein GCM10010206_17020 [Streptomyces cinerochromogenes]|nr:hypothetical protein GCM10010206_17020 [Streptomyces cinerochromogenes]
MARAFQQPAEFGTAAAHNRYGQFGARRSHAREDTLEALPVSTPWHRTRFVLEGHMRIRVLLSSLAVAITVLAGATAAQAAATATKEWHDVGTYATQAQCVAAAAGITPWRCELSSTGKWHLWIYY